MRGKAAVSGAICPAFECDRPANRRGYCERHYRRLMRHGYVKRAYSDNREEWFWSRVDKSGGPDACWPWLGSRTPRGYGKIKIRYRDTETHRVALTYHLGRALVAGLDVAHSCDNPPCCNPAHLREATHAENMQDAIIRGRRPSKNGGTTAVHSKDAEAP